MQRIVPSVFSRACLTPIRSFTTEVQHKIHGVGLEDRSILRKIEEGDVQGANMIFNQLRNNSREARHPRVYSRLIEAYRAQWNVEKVNYILKKMQTDHVNLSSNDYTNAVSICTRQELERVEMLWTKIQKYKIQRTLKMYHELLLFYSNQDNKKIVKNGLKKILDDVKAQNIQLDTKGYNIVLNSYVDRKRDIAAILSQMASEKIPFDQYTYHTLLKRKLYITVRRSVEERIEDFEQLWAQLGEKFEYDIVSYSIKAKFYSNVASLDGSRGDAKKLKEIEAEVRRKGIQFSEHFFNVLLKFYLQIRRDFDKVKSLSDELREAGFR
eukprot:TRINITY_DN10975_c0_g1_i1.p2 TRINITY_DN10975_c0_g1~~TRINITY_DN10975_c0_g1_i1.p2  ORF type:complete len:325 (-),score=176.32 TRINITY_DN10975_c0_g1_i1:71-1045(-)